MTEAKNRLSALIDEVQSGETILIVDHGRPVARLGTAVSGASSDPGGRLARLEREGIVRTSLQAAGEAALGPLPAARRRATGAVAALIAERRAGR